LPISPPKSALDLTIQERRENLSCYSLIFWYLEKPCKNEYEETILTPLAM
jgi:preprotein translocase subunit Sss1